MSDRLKTLFAPKSVAIIGASDKNPWTGFVMATLDDIGFEGPRHLVNPRGGLVIGHPTVASCAAIGEPVDAAFIVVPAGAMEDTLRDMAAAGIGSGVVVTSGFAELGGEGAAAQTRLFALANELRLTLMGPNSLGFVNLVDRVALAAFPVEQPILPDPRVGVISQSGATAGVLGRTAHATNVSLSHVIALGNEATVDLTDAIDFLIDCPVTKAIAVFAETIRRPTAFLATARRALGARKPIVMLKVGVGKLASEIARAHTGALVGDNKVFDAICRDYGIIRVDTLEQLLQTADMIAGTGVIGPGGFAAASISGGACEMIADLGEANGVPFATFSEATTAAIAELLPSYATVQNPLDTTGGILSKMELFGDVLAIAGADEGVAIVAANLELAETAQRDKLGRSAIVHAGVGLKRAAVPGFLLPQSRLSVSAYARETLGEADIALSSAGLGMAMTALGGAFRWSAAVRLGSPPGSATTTAPSTSKRPGSERDVLDYLAARGVPTIPATIARTVEEVAAAVEALAGPAVVKILSPDIMHKTDLGGVALNVNGPDAARTCYTAMMERVSAARPEAHIDGVLVSPMRGQGIELIVGVARDPVWGLVLAVGLGGILVEILADVDLSLLPVTATQAEAILARLKSTRLLDGYRGMLTADRAAIAIAIAAIGDAAIALGDDLLSLEVNPLWVSGGQVECLDALAIWKTDTHEKAH